LGKKIKKRGDNSPWGPKVLREENEAKEIGVKDLKQHDVGVDCKPERGR